MREKKRFLLNLKKYLISYALAGSMIVTLGGCAKHEEAIPEVEHTHKGAIVIIDEESNEMKVIEDNSITGMQMVKRK